MIDDKSFENVAKLESFGNSTEKAELHHKKIKKGLNLLNVWYL
jgi:hypothetical protein